MIKVHGKHNTALCFTTELEESAYKQIKTLCDQEVFSGSKIRIMPDVHAGMGCTIGTTMTIRDKIVPGMVGVDIGCGMQTVKLSDKTMNFARLDELIKREIPAGFSIRNTPHHLNEEIDLEKLRCGKNLNLKRGRLSIGTLGGGNHFIEVNRDEEGNLYLVVHSGSRHLGHETATYYQKEAYRDLKKRGKLPPGLPRDLAYVEGKLFDDYLHDMAIMQRYATLNRKAIMDVLLEGMNLTPKESFTTIHNYVDLKSMILRKGAVSAKKGEQLLIPINMRDGSLLCVGKGNDEWNQSAPHGAGRLMSRKEARSRLDLNQLHKEMKGIYTTSLGKSTLDEAPMAYKPMEDIIQHIEPTVEIVSHLKPIYNFKSTR